jgi:hypothetical protein
VTSIITVEEQAKQEISGLWGGKQNRATVNIFALDILVL